jgi:hypothetical protein
MRIRRNALGHLAGQLAGVMTQEQLDALARMLAQAGVAPTVPEKLDPADEARLKAVITSLEEQVAKLLMAKRKKDVEDEDELDDEEEDDLEDEEEDEDDDFDDEDEFEEEFGDDDLDDDEDDIFYDDEDDE